jgi:large subunit ribosomal protein L1
LLNELAAKRPASAKGIYVRSICVSSTMGPGVRIDATAADPRKEAN